MRLWITILLVTSFLSAGDKIALLIGNNDYAFQPLANPLNDVDGIYKTLKEIGFDISEKDVLKNASKTTMENALANFAQRATTAEIALIYFSGHGMQVNNINYMFPAKTTATKPIHLRTLVDLDYFIQSASSAKYGIVLVDACRNNPLVKYFQDGKKKGTGIKGLGQVTPTTGQVVIGFATTAGDTADDGNGDMSPYAKALSVRLKESDDIRNVLGKVGHDVSKKYEQNPIYKANLADSVYLKGIHKKQFNIESSESLASSFISVLNTKNCSELKDFFINPFLGDGKIISQDNFQDYCQKHFLGKANKDLKVETVVSIDIVKKLNSSLANDIQKRVNSLKKNYDELLLISLSGDRAYKNLKFRMDLIVMKKEKKYYVVGDLR